MNALEELAAEIWAWRADQQSRTRDDIPRIDRPIGWRPQVGLAAVAAARARCAGFEATLAEQHPTAVADRIDHRLLRSLLARVRWELDTVRIWTQPGHYVDQSIGPVFDVLLRPGVDAARVDEVLRYSSYVPAVVDAALPILRERAVREFAELGVAELTDIRDRLHEVADALTAVVPSRATELAAGLGAAADALESFRSALVGWLPALPSWQPVGRAAFDAFLREVACVPMNSEFVQALGAIEFDRAATLERVERDRNRLLPVPPLPADVSEQVRLERAAELTVRAFYADRRLLSQPESLAHYRNLPLPEYLAPLSFLGVADDLTGPDRLDEDGISYVPAPTAELSYFYAANARDPRAGIVHEGAHYQQLALSWSNPRPIRRHYYDSTANEGIAFYNEELMLAAGLFDDARHTRTTMYNFMRLRALRATVDVGLATGELTVEQAAERLRTRVPMDDATAREEAAFFAGSPGQALSYQVGKTQLLAMVADAVRVRGEELSLQDLHDYIWVNGNVPIALLRWELLGLTDELAGLAVTE